MYSTCLKAIWMSWREPMSELFHVNECSLTLFHLQDMRGPGSTIINRHIINTRTNTHLCARTHLSTAIEKIKQVHLCKHWWSRPDVCRLNASCHLRAQERVLPSLCVFSPQKDTYTLLFSTHMCVWRKPNRRIDKRRPVSLDYIQFSSVWTSYSKQIINACKRLRFSGNMFSFLTNPVTSITRNRHTAANQIAASHICVTHLGQPTQRHFSVSM